MDSLNSEAVHQTRTSSPEVFLGKGFLKKCRRFIEEHPCRSAFLINILCNLLYIFRTPFPKNTTGGGASSAKLLVKICGIVRSSFLDALKRINWHLLVQSKNWKTRAMCGICSKLTIKSSKDVNDVVVVSLSSIVSIVEFC